MDDDAEVAALQPATDGDSRDAVWTALAALDTQVVRLRNIVAEACKARDELVVAEEAVGLVENVQAMSSPPAESSRTASAPALKNIGRRLYGWASRAARPKP
jgi:hypothetical protein